MEKLLRNLNFKPWRVFCGDVDLLELSAIVSMSALHLGGDSGGNHLAWMCGIPSVTWYRNFEGLPEWILRGDRRVAFVGEQNDAGIRGIRTQDLLDASLHQLGWT
jgi:ADP-heptose:LPS heptosyltransferase